MCYIPVGLKDCTKNITYRTLRALISPLHLPQPPQTPAPRTDLGINLEGASALPVKAHLF